MSENALRPMMADILEKDQNRASRKQDVVDFFKATQQLASERATMESAGAVQASSAEGEIKVAAHWRVTQNRAGKPSNDLNKDKLEQPTAISPLFEGALNRQSLASAMKTFRAETGLSQRAFAKEFSIPLIDLRRIEAAEGTLDKAVERMAGLGLKARVSIIRHEIS